MWPPTFRYVLEWLAEILLSDILFAVLQVRSLSVSSSEYDPLFKYCHGYGSWISLVSPGEFIARFNSKIGHEPLFRDHDVNESPHNDFILCLFAETIIEQREDECDVDKEINDIGEEWKSKWEHEYDSDDDSVTSYYGSDRRVEVTTEV
jgi:hypothetical protein